MTLQGRVLKEHRSRKFNKYALVLSRSGLTEEVVPLGVQVGLVGQTPPQHVQTVVLARLQRHLARAVGTVQHLHGRSHAAGRHSDLEEEEEEEEEEEDCYHHSGALIHIENVLGLGKRQKVIHYGPEVWGPEFSK